MSLFLLILSFIMSFIFMQMKHPLAMGFMLLIQTCLISLFMGIFMQTFWFSYILFLIFMGGMLVLFIYVTSLSSNEMFSFSMKLMIFFSFFFVYSLFVWFLDNSYFDNFIMNNEMNILTNSNFMFEDCLSLNKMYNFPTNLITIMLVNYLFLTLLMTVKITKKNYGPLRPMN
uniref:NADH-ubiquinone oxidoreductase chain 6 n=1 Tax=Trichoprosopon pallidiventer TaxID=2007230 RepID=A0A5B9HEY6_9DIPT|nr:NADH dehydrogenase subunit 6 [Trichoprosopon pallidiventer]QEE94434.1 NADH dehydrogenase subunit 6 [Trichoprosopon pallidiventer]